MRTKKSIGLWGLFLVLLLPLLSPVLLQLSIGMVQATAEERLERAHLQTLHIPLTRLHWTRQGRELLIEGRLFDVKEYSKNDDALVVKGVYDDDETALEQQLDSLGRQQKKRQDVALVRYFQVLGSSCFSADLFQLKPFGDAPKAYNEVVVHRQKEIYIPIPCPPPQV